MKRKKGKTDGEHRVWNVHAHVHSVTDHSMVDKVAPSMNNEFPIERTLLNYAYPTSQIVTMWCTTNSV